MRYNRDLFGSELEVRSDEKTRTDFLIQRSAGQAPTAEDLEQLLDLEAMPGLLPHYVLSQVAGETLGADAADLIVMDNYADMNFQAWRHREHGWDLWIHPKFLRAPEAFAETFEKRGWMTFEESVESHVRLIRHYRAIYGDHVPVLYLNQPIAYYRKLEGRSEFRDLGPRLESELPRVFSGDIADEALEVADMGSCGEGQTLHFTGPTYRTMIMQALEKGLSECLSSDPASFRA